MWEARKCRFYRQRSKGGERKSCVRELGTLIGVGGATAFCLVFALSVMILLAGDVERNPGPLAGGTPATGSGVTCHDKIGPPGIHFSNTTDPRD